MAGNLSNYAENKILDLSVGRNGWSKPALYCALYTDPPTDGGTGTEVLSATTVGTAQATGYFRVKITESDAVYYGSFSTGGSTSITTTYLDMTQWYGSTITILTGDGAGSTGTVESAPTTTTTTTTTSAGTTTTTTTTLPATVTINITGSWSGTAPTSAGGLFMLTKTGATVWSAASDGMIKNGASYKAKIQYDATYDPTASPAPTLNTASVYLVTKAETSDTTTGLTLAVGDFIKHNGTAWAKVSTPFSITSETTTPGRIEFPAALVSWGTVRGIGLHDAATGGNLIWYGTLSIEKAVVLNDVVAFSTNDIVLSLD